MDLSRFATANYWLNTSPSAEIHNLKFWLILFSFLSLFGGLTLINRFISKRIRNKMATLLLLTGLIGLTLLFFRFEGIYLLSTRALFLVLFLISLFLLIDLLIYLVKKYPKELQAIAKYKEFSSYLPQKKRK